MFGPQNPRGALRGRASQLPSPGELAAMIRDGLTVDDIADALNAAPGTIAHHITNAGYDRGTGNPRQATAVDDITAELAALIVPGKWVERALCAQTDPEEFFPEKGGSTRAAKAICAACPVAAECLDYALASGERYGIWGGVSERDRRKLNDSVTCTCTVCGHTFETPATPGARPKFCGDDCRTTQRRRTQAAYDQRHTHRQPQHPQEVA